MKGVILIYCFDLDGTLCSLTGGAYASAEPIEARVNHVNKLFDEGHTIKIFTARGATSKKPWLSLTRTQLDNWGIRHHELIMGKPDADIFIDDKAIHSDSYPWS